jgi:cytochrome c-type biogenesis protein CcmF
VTADLGYGMTLVALGLAVYGGLAAGIGAKTGRLALVESAQHAALGVFALVTSCFALLTYAFLTFDFSVRYVATNTNLGTPFYYRITGVWGALEGSIILWSWMLALYTIILIVRHRSAPASSIPGRSRRCSASSPSSCS